MIDIIVFSNDNACKLDACLRSIEQNFEYGQITVLYDFSNKDFLKAYVKLAKEYSKKPVYFVYQQPFKRVFREVLNSASENVLLIRDDVIINKKVNTSFIETRMKLFRGNNFNLTMGIHITSCFENNEREYPVRVEYFSEFMVWWWKDSVLDCGYPNMIDATIYKNKWLQFITKLVDFDTPVQLEDKLNKWFVRLLTPPKNMSFSRAHAIKLQMNETESLKSLNEKYLEGNKINVEPFMNKEWHTNIIEPNLTWINDEYSEEAL